MNEDGRLSINEGATLVELKKKKNAAGSYPSYSRLTALAPHYMKTPIQVPETYGETKSSFEELTCSMEIADRSKKFDRKPLRCS